MEGVPLSSERITSRRDQRLNISETARHSQGFGARHRLGSAPKRFHSLPNAQEHFPGFRGYHFTSLDITSTSGRQQCPNPVTRGPLWDTKMSVTAVTVNYAWALFGNTKRAFHPKYRNRAVLVARALGYTLYSYKSMVNRKISRDLKERAVALVLSGSSVTGVADILGVSVDSVKRWSRNLRSLGDVQPHSALRGRRRVLSNTVLESIQDLIASSPSLYLDEIVSWLAVAHDQPVSISALQRSLVALGYTYKRLRKTAAQRDELTRSQWKADILSRFTANQLVFADESSKDNRTLQRQYGRAPSGERASEVLSFARGVRYSILPALSIDGFLTVRVVRGSVDGSEFYDWVLSDLVSHFPLESFIAMSEPPS